MGQSVSRRRESPPTPEPISESPALTESPGTSSEPFQIPSNNRVRHMSEGAASRQSSVRRSLLNFVKPSNIRGRVNSIASTPGDIRRSWRNSRRLSRAPVDPVLATEIDDPMQPSSSTPALAGPSHIDKGKRPERRAFVDEEDEDEYHEAVEEQPIYASTSMAATDAVSPVASTSAPISQHIEEHSEDAGLQDPVADNSEAISAPPTMQPSPSPPPLPPPLPQAIPRQFPPPGTLVIVQGVVHTTDISRTAPSQEPPNPAQEIQDDLGRSRTRDRLSALLRPGSTSRPSSAVSNEPPAVTVTPSETRLSPSTFDESPSLSPASSEPTLTTPTGPTQSVDTPTEPQLSPQRPEIAPAESRHPSISSSSIDVLGTLLSVAAAATAASLLTGSSEPILSSGLAPPPPPPPASIPPVPAYPPPPLPPRMATDSSATSRADRMRQAWSTIRERLGLRPSPPAGPAIPSDENGVPPPGAGGLDSAPTDARELMLAEMARAFNIGLGLNGLGGASSNPGDESRPAGGPADLEAVGPSGGTENDTNSQAGERNSSPPPPPAASETPPPITLPPEGSFERFLVDLQLDLRLALTRPEGETTPSTDQGAAPQAQPPQLPRPLASTSPSDSTTTSPAAAPSVIMQPGPSETVSQTSPILSASPASEAPEDRPSYASQTTDAESLTGSLPFTEFGSDDSEDEADDDFDDEDFHSANRDSLHGEDHHNHHNHELGGQNGTTHSGMGRIDSSGRINWWRLYRFPQITSITIDMAAAAGLRQAGSRGGSNTEPEVSPATTTPSPSPPSTSTSSTPLTPMPERPTSEPSTHSSSSPNVDTSEGSMGSQPPPPPISNSRTVVPVIIVGLQSVNPEWRDMMTPDDTNLGGQPGSNNNADNADSPNPGGTGMTDEGLDGDAGLFGSGGNIGEPTRGRGRSRGWPSRAANALRNLRPGRRNADAGRAASQSSNPSNGSRTFLIYVIGGYYPPEHSIVTGGPNNFDSFEALLELADLLGQVKPSTVSKEEIEKSGLEVVKAAVLPEYFKEDKITANCLDRCLVCLEDYQPEEDVRVMRCRHVFHKGCVDEWMQKGRNNCPACRSTGVPTESRDVPA